MITGFSILEKMNKIKKLARIFLNNSYNNIITYLPFNFLRIFVLKYFLKMKVGENVIIAPRVKIINPWRISIGNNTIINSSVFLDGRGGLKIGNNVDIAWFSKIITYQHNYNDSSYKAYGSKVKISDNCCLTVNSVILPGVSLAEGVVIGVSSIVTKSISNKYTICAGVPSREINKRKNIIEYKLMSRSLTI
jgi:acetyltransferase-like isoleucine patch superfamily enzyme